MLHQYFKPFLGQVLLVSVANPFNGRKSQKSSDLGTFRASLMVFTKAWKVRGKNIEDIAFFSLYQCTAQCLLFISYRYIKLVLSKPFDSFISSKRSLFPKVERRRENTMVCNCFACKDRFIDLKIENRFNSHQRHKDTHVKRLSQICVR